MKYLSEEDQKELGLVPTNGQKKDKIIEQITTSIAEETNDAAPTCPNCGSFLRLLGTCWTCMNCAWNEGSCG